MAGKKSVYVCGECGYESGRWMGKCPGCEAWNTMVEEIQQPARPAAAEPAQSPRLLREIGGSAVQRLPTGSAELDRVLGGGLVRGSAVLLGGDPGIGKSTLLLQVCHKLSQTMRVLYASGEESAQQIQMRAARLGLDGPELYVLCETDLDTIEGEARRLECGVLVVDSVQTVSRQAMSSAPGSVSQVREATTALTRLAKQTGAAVFIVGHVTKEGAIAGPRVLEHLVDTVLYFEGDRHDSFRILRAVKNRFGSTNEIGVFEMAGQGMREVSDPSALFLSEREEAVPGCAVHCALEGSRPVLVEVQALVCPTAFGMPRRMSAGVDYNRMLLLLAVLEKKLGLRLGDQDVYVNVAGGLKLEDRAADLAVAAAVVSSLRNIPLPWGTVCLGEMGLTGEIRPVSGVEKRMGECAKLGFTRLVLPRSNVPMERAALRIESVRTARDALRALFPE